MTISSLNVRSGPYTGTNSVDTYSYTFKVLESSHLVVTETTNAGVESVLVEGTDYSVTGAGNETGGTVVRTAGNLPTDYTWLIERVTPRTQSADFPAQGAFTPQAHEDAFDKLTGMMQETEDTMNIAVRAPASDVNPDMELPIAADRATKFLRFTAGGDVEAAEISTTGTALSQDVIAGYYEPESAVETAAGATVINFQYHQGNPLRYGNNTVPGTTDMTTPVQDAVNVAEAGSGKVYMDEGIYLCNVIIDSGITIFSSIGVILKGNTAAAVVQNNADFVNVVGGLKIDGDSTSVYCWHQKYSNNGTFSGLWLTGATSHGLYVEGDDLVRGSYYNCWYNTVSKTNAGDGIKIYGTKNPDNRANANNFFGGQIAANTGNGLTFDRAVGTSLIGLSIETNGGYGIETIECEKVCVTMIAGWIEGNTSGGVTIDATSRMPVLIGTRVNQANEWSGAGMGTTGTNLQVDSAAGVLTRWFELTGANLQAPYIVAPNQVTTKISAVTADHSVSALTSGQSFHLAASGPLAAVTATLPAAVLGLKYRFVRGNVTHEYRVDPVDGSEVIRDGATAGAGGKYLQLDTNHGSVDIECLVTGVWEVVGQNSGTISFEA